MDALPENDPSPASNGHSTAAQARRAQEAQDMGTTYVPEHLNLGEHLLPFVFAAAEACWIDAIFIGLVAIHFFQLSTPFMPLWAPFLLLAGSHWLAIQLERRDIAAGKIDAEEPQRAVTSGTPVLVGLLVLTILLIIWASLYAPTRALWNPTWLLAMLNDILLLQPNAYHIFVLILLSLLFAWRGIARARRTIEPGEVFTSLRLGMGVIIFVILVTAGANQLPGYGLFLLGLLPCFLCLELIAHALSKVIFVRDAHAGGLLGSVEAQERSLLTVVVVIGLALLLIAFALGLLISPNFLVDVQAALSPIAMLYNLITSGLAYAITFLLTPFFWLFSLIPFHFVPLRQFQPPQSVRTDAKLHQTVPPQSVVVTIVVLKVVLPFIFIGIVIFFIWWLLRRRRAAFVRRNLDLHESLWSWGLFKMQLRALWLALWHRLFPPKAVETQMPAPEEPIEGTPAARSIREIYRLLLRWAASRGLARKKDETPFELKQRLQERLPDIESELGVVTSAYAAVRYGEAAPDQAEIARVQQSWLELQQKG
ncbi:DUF4129 domain-containing protein [Ktedonosporobacter rubrisoli]|nr:DUF4129 domain-containing protein [Ktedonosporobacter rubrisoli]